MTALLVSALSAQTAPTICTASIQFQRSSSTPGIPSHLLATSFDIPDSFRIPFSYYQSLSRFILFDNTATLLTRRSNTPYPIESRPKTSCRQHPHRTTSSHASSIISLPTPSIETQYVPKPPIRPFTLLSDSSIVGANLPLTDPLFVQLLHLPPRPRVQHMTSLRPSACRFLFLLTSRPSLLSLYSVV